MINENIDFKEIQKLSGFTEEKEAKVLLWFEFLIYNFDTNEFDVLSEVQIVEPQINIKFINSGILLDVSFQKEKENYYELAKFLNMYEEIKNDDSFITSQRLTIIPVDNPLEQYILADPIFTEKHANKVGRNLDSFRFLYNTDNFVGVEMEMQEQTEKEVE